MRLVLDTNVVVAAVRSPSGASAALVRSAVEGGIVIVCNPALFLEYEAVLKRPDHLAAAGLSSADIDALLSALAGLIEPAGRGVSTRPSLPDPDDEFVLEAAVAGKADAIVTFETRTFVEPARLFGIDTMTPATAWGKVKP